MWNDTVEGQQTLAEISKDIIVTIAPEEMDVADELLEEYFANPPQQTAKDDPLGFGGEIMVAATPVIAMALSAVFRFLVDEVIKSAKTESAALIAQKVKAFFTPTGPKPEATLSQEQLRKIKDLVKKELSRGGMNPKKSEDAALRIVARLAVAGR